MFTIGTSAYLKLLSLSEKRQKSELSKRFAPSDGGYDFHKSLRRAAKQLLAQGRPLATIIESLAQIANPPERKSATEGLKSLARWQNDLGLKVFEVPSTMIVSPNQSFKLNFEPDFGAVIDGRRIALHLWNTKSPDLSERSTVATLSMLKVSYAELDAFDQMTLPLAGSSYGTSMLDVEVAAAFSQQGDSDGNQGAQIFNAVADADGFSIGPQKGKLRLTF